MWWWWWWLSTCIAHYAERLYYATCPGALWKGMSSVLIEKIRCWAMDHGDDQAAGSRPSDLPRRMPDVRTYCDDDVVRSADGEWQIGDADDSDSVNVNWHHVTVKCCWQIKLLLACQIRRQTLCLIVYYGPIYVRFAVKSSLRWNAS